MKALVFALPLFFVLGSIAKAETPTCDWAAEAFKSKVGEACVKSLDGKLTDEQDKISARRIIKEWAPMTGYEIAVEPGFYQAYNETTGDFFQAQWLSYEPAVLYVNGELVMAAGNEPSMYRQIEKLFDQAAKQQKTASLSPFMKFLAPNEAYAAATAPQARVAGNFFLFTVNDKAETAADILKKDADGKVSDSGLKSKGILPGASSVLGGEWGGHQTFKCDASGSRLQQSTQKLDGKDVVIKPVAGSRTQFVVSGYPEVGMTLKVEMQTKSNPALPRELLYRKKDQHGYPLYAREDRRAFAWATPCSGLHSDKIDSACKGAWSEFAAMKDDAGKEKFPEAKAFLEKLPKDKEALYGKDVKCEKVFNGDRIKAEACRQYLRARFQPGGNQRFEKFQAKIEVCDGIDCGKTKPLPKDEAVGPSAPLAPNDRMQYEVVSRRAYVAALAADKNRPQSIDPIKTCPIGVGKVDGRGPRSMEEFQKCEQIVYQGQSQAVKDAFKAVAAGPEHAQKIANHDDFRTKLDNRLLGVMMMGDCCGSKACADLLADKQHITLDGAKTTQ